MNNYMASNNASDVMSLLGDKESFIGESTSDSSAGALNGHYPKSFGGQRSGNSSTGSPSAVSVARRVSRDDNIPLSDYPSPFQTAQSAADEDFSDGRHKNNHTNYGNIVRAPPAAMNVEANFSKLQEGAESSDVAVKAVSAFLKENSKGNVALNDQRCHHQDKRRKVSFSTDTMSAASTRMKDATTFLRMPRLPARKIDQQWPIPLSAVTRAGPVGETNQSRDLLVSSDMLAATFNLHQVCRYLGDQLDVAEISLSLDPGAIRRQLDKQSSEALVKSRRMRGDILGNYYRYPINIALQNNASLPVLELLVIHGKDVLVKGDGREKMSSLSIALCHKPRDLRTIDLILFANPQGSSMTDRRLNFPLHVACAKGASVDVLKRLYFHYPAALFQKNFNRETPLDICCRSTRINEGAVNFLTDRFNAGCLQMALRNIGCPPEEHQRQSVRVR